MKKWDDKKDKIKNTNKQMRSVWWLPAINKKEKKYGYHPTQKPLELLNRIISATSRKGDKILDPFCGTGTTGIIANKLQRKFVGIEINENYIEIIKKRYKNISEIKLYQPKNTVNITKFM